MEEYKILKAIIKIGKAIGMKEQDFNNTKKRLNNYLIKRKISIEQYNQLINLIGE